MTVNWGVVDNKGCHTTIFDPEVAAFWIQKSRIHALLGDKQSFILNSTQ